MSEPVTDGEAVVSRSAPLWTRRPFWYVVGVLAAALALGTAWAVRHHRRSEAMQVLNTFEPFDSPPVEINFSALLADTEANRAALEAGAREGVWRLVRRPPPSEPRPKSSGKIAKPVLEVQLTEQGQRWFSVVADQIVATFQAGRRQVTRVDGLDGVFPSRHVRFHYSWTQLHPGDVVLGAGAPQPRRDYEGEALLYYEHERWRVLHWNTPDFDLAVARFSTLESPR